MQKMLIQLDVEKIERENKYDVDKMWQTIDEIFSEGRCIKEIQSDGSVMYSGNPNSENHLADIGIAYMTLSELKWFAESVKKWIWYDNDDDESLPFAEEDVLYKERRDNPLFAIK